MNARLVKLQEWIRTRTSREMVLFFALGLVFTYLIWEFLLARPLTLKHQEKVKEINDKKMLIDATELQIKAILSITTSKEFTKISAEQKSLTDQSKNLKGELQNLSLTFVSPAQIHQITSDILSQQEAGVTIANLKDIPPIPWRPLGAEEMKLSSGEIHKYGLQINFDSAYFTTINYLERLEKLKWPLYWDSLQYKVTTYPDAEVTVTLYVLSDKKR